jgi:D-arabinose 1-dehydrogenase-like Zn-dependent alcohol dehydrogenase
MYGYHGLDQGSFGSHAIWREAFLFRIPPSLERKDAAPLMCAGATVFNALQQFGTKPTDRVGVVSIGGLGHLAIQFAAKIGCNVVAFSQTESKKAEAMMLGASEFFATKGTKELKIGAGIDHLLACTSQQPDWKLLLPVMAPNGYIYPLRVSEEEFKMPYRPINEMQLRVQGNLVAPRQVHREMLEFAARHGIRPIIENFR